MYSDIYGELNEKFYSDDDDTVMYEDVEDIDSSGDEMAKYYDKIYEEEVAPGSFYQISIEPHPMKPGLIILSQDNRQTIVVNREDINALINILRKLA